MPLNVDPPLLNSANPWASTEEDLRALYASPYTGAVTTRTCLLNGFTHDDNVHQYTFFNTRTSLPAQKSITASSSIASAPNHSNIDGGGSISEYAEAKSSLNTLGYSPFPLSYYLDAYLRITAEQASHRKPFIISVTGTPDEIVTCYHAISLVGAQSQNPQQSRLLIEINLSCPNIPSAPPPAYSGQALTTYLDAIADAKEANRSDREPDVGIKTPPFTYGAQFSAVIDALTASVEREKSLGREPRSPIQFITATNTLGNCLVMSNEDGKPALASATGLGIGGLAGEALHPLALGNVRTFRNLLDQVEVLKDISIIGVGGVSDAVGAQRMRQAGAEVVGVGTALGREGIKIFEKIHKNCAY
ncbi:MAG: hypothetical protein M4579_005776 [Chaenotheca gracillima]|nr:MAG: hypothetical protein M4579_005776 [Chaenotheca gracillima]